MSDEIRDTIMPFGKHKGKPFSEIPMWYFDWLIQQTDLHPIMRERVRAHMDNNKLMNLWNKEKQKTAGWKDNGK